MRNKFKIQFNTQIWQEGNMFVAYNPQLDLSSCGKTIEQAKKNIFEATQLFFVEAKKIGTLNNILEEAGFAFDNEWKAPEMVVFEKMSLAF